MENSVKISKKLDKLEYSDFLSSKENVYSIYGIDDEYSSGFLVLTSKRFFVRRETDSSFTENSILTDSISSVYSVKHKRDDWGGEIRLNLEDGKIFTVYYGGDSGGENFYRELIELFLGKQF